MRKHYLSIIILLLVFTAGCKAVNDQGAERIDAKEAKAMMDAGGVTIVDVRTKEEYDEGHIEGAILIPVDTIGVNNLQELPDKNAVILVYCRSGRRSAQAAARLYDMGYSNVYDFGGIGDWTYETVKGK